MQLFYAPSIAEDPFLPEEEAYHCLKVLRYQEGDEIFVTDGSGGFYKCRITRAGKKQVQLAVHDKMPDYGKKNYTIHICVAPTKNIARMEWMVEKLTEAGVDQISFIRTARSERKHLKPERLHKIAVNAMKQSAKAYLPDIQDICSFTRMLNDEIKETQRFFGHQQEGYNNHLFVNVKPATSYIMVIGPEGDFNDEEVEQLKTKDFMPVSLGDSRLRTETAAFTACCVLNLINQV